jgi:hypothetical protein
MPEKSFAFLKSTRPELAALRAFALVTIGGRDVVSIAGISEFQTSFLTLEIA